MDPTDSFPTELARHEDAFGLTKPDEFADLGIDPADIPAGTFAALKHPSHVQSRYGGNAYGFGLFDIWDRLRPKDIRLLQSIDSDNRELDGGRHRELNRIYEKLGLLIRYTSQGSPYYLIPVGLISNSLTHLKAKVDEISGVVGFHEKKFHQEHHRIAVVTDQDDLLIQELSFRFKEHSFEVIDSLDRLRRSEQELDLVILTRDIFDIVLMEKFFSLPLKKMTRGRIKQYAGYLIWKIYNLLKPNGELFIISGHHTPKTNRSTKLVFKTLQEEINFLLFTHIFKTRKRYQAKTTDGGYQVNIFDLQCYLSGVYVEQELVNRLLDGTPVEDATPELLGTLPYLDHELTDRPFRDDQEKDWSKITATFFDRVILKPLIPKAVKKDWKTRFSFSEYRPNYLLVYLGQKRPLKATASDIKHEVSESRLMGCPIGLLADYKDSFEYVIRTLRVLEGLKKEPSRHLPEIYADRLRQPLENKKRRFSAINDVLKLIAKIGRLETIRAFLNPDQVEGPTTEVLSNLEALSFFGFTHQELREIVLIVLGHTPLGRIVSGKLTEKALKPLTDLARTYDSQEAINLLRYCRLMTMAEIEASQGNNLSIEQLTELFDLYASAVRVIMNKDLDWDRLLDEKITAMGGIHNNVVRKLLKMINHFEFVDNWNELGQKGHMEKEALADYGNAKLRRIENVIRLVETVERFEERFLEFDPLELPALYRRFLEIEFHGTGHLFEMMDSRQVFTLLWITVNAARGDIINFNPILADVTGGDARDRIERVGKEAGLINFEFLDRGFLRQLGQQLHRYGSAFILGTGFQLRVDPDTQVVDIAYMDMPQDIEELEAIVDRLEGSDISHFSVTDLKKMEFLFSNLESFYQGHLRLPEHPHAPPPKLPGRQKRWFQKIGRLREQLNSRLNGMIFRPETVYTDLYLLNRHAPTLLNFILPEFTALEDLDLSWHLYLKAPVTEYIIAATRKLQALVTHDKENFQDIHLSHRLAQREFGPLATGIIGVSESQIDALENIISRLEKNPPLFKALTMAFIFQDVGRLSHLREKYGNRVNPADLTEAGALFMEEENLAVRFGLTAREKACLVFLVRYHSLLHHYIRGEYSFWSLQDILDTRDPELCDALFVLSFIMLSAIREDLMVEDLAGQLFQIRTFCRRVLMGENTLKSQLDELYDARGTLYYGLENYQIAGLPDGIPPTRYLESGEWETPARAKRIRSGKMIFATERLFRLGGIRYVGFRDLVSLMLDIPLRFTYKKRQFTAVGFATFEREAYEALRIYNTLHAMDEDIRHFILNRLVEDKVRIFGFEKISVYLNYENRIKLLLAGLLGTRKIVAKGTPISVNFLNLAAKVKKRYEPLNEYLNTISVEKLWKDKKLVNSFFTAASALILRKDQFPNVINVDFQDPFNIAQKIAYMGSIGNVEQLKNYFHSTLQSLRKIPYYTDDYELELERVFEKRLFELTDLLLDQTKKQMDLIGEIAELHSLDSDLMDRSGEIGFSEDQKHRLNDLYQLRNDNIMREKLREIEADIKTIQNTRELKDYWDSIKWYLQNNRRFFGKEFENLIAKKFDKAEIRLADE